MEQYEERLYWHIRGMVNTHENANDVVQNTLVKVFRNIAKFKGQSKLYTWLYRIATNEALTFLKKEQRRHSEDLDGEEKNHLNTLPASSSVDGEQAWEALQKAIEQLPDKQKTVFVLRYFDEMSYRDMSETLKTSEGALKASFHHALKKVEKYLRETELYC
ncbi:MAG TPA: RNA polymerase sigma factor [Phaeodactylibacter sp.]|nr:RNA polymerase sigma factor [Phaeodactylibacter sp.]